ncbi:MAG: integrase family protein [Rhodospirillales bacterium]|nr:integrase family protein [Rhodospirillales bacterium]
MRITDIQVRNLPAPEKGSKVYYEDTLKGFGVRVSNAGTKAFILATGKNRDRTTIGRYPTISLAEARDVAKKLMAERTLGRHQARNTTMGAALDQFTEEHVSKLAQSTKSEIERLFTKHLAKLRAVKLDDVSTQDFTKITAKLAPSEGEHLHRATKTFFRWCVARRMIPHSPLEGIRPPSKWTPRERVLSDEELRAIFKALGDDRFSSIVRLLIHLGQRRTETASIVPIWVKDDILTIPKDVTKNRREHSIPITESAKAIVPLLAPFNGWSKAKVALDKDAKIAPWTLHDLRRTFATGLQRLGVRLEVTEALLNHVSGTKGGIAGVYQRYNWMPEMRAALRLWENHLQSLLPKE